MSLQPALAQERQGDDNTAAIIVTGAPLPAPPGTPAYGSVIIARDRLANTASGRVEDALRDVAGFQQFRRSDSRTANPSAQGATLRALGGNASSRTLVLLDGVPMADPFFGYIPFDAIAPERLSAVRVTRGGGAGAFGAGAVAGVIEMESAGRQDLSVLSGSAAYGSKNASELSATLAPSMGAGFVSLSGRWDRGDGFQTTPAGQRVAATVPARYESWSTGLRAVAPLTDNTDIQFRALVFRDTRTLRFAGADSMSEGQDASIRLVSRGKWQVDALVYVQARNFSNIVISPSTFTKSLDQRNTPSTGIGGKIELRPPVGPDHVLRVGVDMRLAQGDMHEDAYNATTGAVTARRHASGKQSNGGLFIEDDWTLGRLVLTAGGRIDRWTITDGLFENRPVGGAPTITRFDDRHDTQATARAGALFRISDGVAIRSAAYTGYRLPTLNELYRPFRVGADATGPNAALRPERLKGAEAGIDLTPMPGVSLGVTGFYNRLNNAIANVTVGQGPGTFPIVGFVAAGGIYRQRQNVDAIVAKGIELTGSARAGQWSLSASYAYSDSKVKARGTPFDGLAPAQSPRHSASATLSWLANEGSLVSATLRHVGRQYEDDLQSDALPAATTVDTLARVALGPRIAVQGRIENVFGETVVTRNAGGSIDLGTPRTFWIGLLLR